MFKFSKKDKQDEFLDLIDANQGIVIKICRMYTQTKDDFDDLYQEILIQGWQSFPRFKGEAKFSTWLYKISINTALTHKKKERPFRECSDITDVTFSNSETQSAFENKDLLSKAIATLNDSDKAFLILHLDGYSYEEIAETMGLTISHTGVKLNRIKNKLKDLLVNN